MASITENSSIKELQEFVNQIYLLPNDRDFELAEMLSNIQRFAMRGVKGIRQGNPEKAKINTMLSTTWFSSIMTRLHIDIEETVWNRFPSVCSYCGKIPCSCKIDAVQGRKKVIVDDSKKPKTMQGFQEMFEKIYPAKTRTLEIAGLHLSEELGELSESIWTFRSEKRGCDLDIVVKEAGDYFSTVFGVFNSLNSSLAKELSELFYDNCHVCHKAPCECTYQFIRRFK